MKHYNLIEEKYLENEQCQALVYEHESTKAKILVMKTEDNNKVFGIGFKTPPKTSNGVCHIIEHAVLNGSKKYRTKEPFMDMVKGSLYTFLNAMTYPDKTIYPVASRNDKDFRNLTDLYLDAVFNPRARTDEKIFRQEGWRYNLEDDKLTYKGVVYNEMRGAMSSQESQVYKNIYAELFPDTIYGLNSGGDPYVIPELTYKDFTDYYDEFYHPSNSYIFLYGDMDHEEYLEYIHQDYLANYSFREVSSDIEEQNSFDLVRESQVYINTTKDENPKDSFISYSAIVGMGSDSKDRILAALLSSALINNESSTLRQKLLASGLLDVIFSASQNAQEATFSIVAKNIDPKDKEAFVKIIEDELAEIVEKGIDKDLIMTELNSYKFDIREKGNYATKGIVYFMNAFDSWLYGGSPIEAIDIFDDIKFIEENIDKGLIEKFIKERILDQKHKSIVCHIPKKGLNEERDRQLQEDLNAKLAAMSEEEKKELIDFRIKMDAFQNRENTEEEKATIPMLEKDDVEKQVERIERQVEKKDKFTFVKHELPTSGIDYINILFDIDHITDPEDIKYLSLLCYAYTMLDTENYKYSDLNKYIYLNTDGVYFKTNQYRDDKNDKIYRKLSVKTKTFSENIENACQVVEEVVNNTIFTSKERMKEILSMIKANNEMGLLQSGHAYMMNRAASNHIEYLSYNELIKGIDFHLFINEIVEMDLELVLSKLEDLSKRLFTTEGLIVNVASTFENADSLEKSLEKLVDTFPSTEFEKSTFAFEAKTRREAFATTADVNYLSYGNKLSEEYNSKYLVLNNLVSNEYLYSEIRAKSGAYGAGMTTNQSGIFATYSYRDPNLEKTLETYKNIPTYLENAKVSEEDLLPVIIGAVGKLNPAKTEKAKADLDLSLYIGNKSYEELDEMIENALETTMKDLREKAPVLEKALETASLAVLGNSNLLKEKAEMFDTIIEL